MAVFMYNTLYSNILEPGFRVSYRIFWWGWKKFVGHCHSIMYEYETTIFQALDMRLYKFSSFEYEAIHIFKGGFRRAPHPLYETL